MENRIKQIKIEGNDDLLGFSFCNGTMLELSNNLICVILTNMWKSSTFLVCLVMTSFTGTVSGPRHFGRNKNDSYDLPWILYGAGR